MGWQRGAPYGAHSFWGVLPHGVAMSWRMGAPYGAHSFWGVLPHGVAMGWRMGAPYGAEITPNSANHSNDCFCQASHIGPLYPLRPCPPSGNSRYLPATLCS
jgi:hypothetical protein